MTIYPIKVFPASATRTWAIYSVCGAGPSGTMLCCDAWDGTMRYCKAVLQFTPYTFGNKVFGSSVAFVITMSLSINVITYQSSLPN